MTQTLTKCPACGSTRLVGHACTKCPQDLKFEEYNRPMAKDLRIIAQSVCIAAGITMNQLMGRCREPRFAYPRWVFYKLATDYGYRPYPLSLMLQRQSRTIYHGLDRINEILGDSDNDQIYNFARNTYKKAGEMIAAEIETLAS